MSEVKRYEPVHTDGPGATMMEEVDGRYVLYEDYSEIEQAYRQELWINHGHVGAVLYGDDGEMQCKSCKLWDYKRSPLAAIREQANAARLLRVMTDPEAPRG